LRRRSSSSAALRAIPNSHARWDQRRDALAAAQLVQRRVARDPEQPRALGPAARVEALPAPVRALERGHRHVLRGGTVAQQRHRVGEDI
jgi:hypothetical protein